MYRQSFALLTSLFFMWGFITVTNDVLINAFRGIFQLSAFQAGLVQFAFFGAYFVISLIYFLLSSLSGQDPINRMGYQNGMAISLLVCGLGCGLFYPAGQAQSYGLFLLALFVLASGVTFLQICANPYAAIMGSPQTASSRLNLAQGFNSLGTTVGPLVAVILIFRVFSTGEATVASVTATYLVYAAIFILMAALIKWAKMPQPESTPLEKGFGVLAHRPLLLGIGAIFFYVGGEVAIGSYLVELFQHPNIGALDQETANYYLAYYWGGAMIGRLMGALSLNHTLAQAKRYAGMALLGIALIAFIYFVTAIKNDAGVFHLHFIPIKGIFLFSLFWLLNFLGFYMGKGDPAFTLSIFSAAVIWLLMLGIFGSGQAAFWSVIAVGLFNSIMWSNIFTLAIRDLGNYTSQGSSLLVMAVVGGALIPPLMGALVDGLGIQWALFLPMLSYIYLFFYGQRVRG